jgi:hypothetical protein
VNGNVQLDWEKTLPVLLVDFDARRLVSRFPNPNVRFEDFVPPGWTGEQASFLEAVPAELRYWIVEGRDYSPVARPNTPAGRRLGALLIAEAVVLVVCVAGAFLLHHQGKPVAGNRLGVTAFSMFGAIFATGIAFSMVRYGIMGEVRTGIRRSARMITRLSHPYRYRIYCGVGIAIGFGIFLCGLYVLVSRWGG